MFAHRSRLMTAVTGAAVVAAFAASSVAGTMRQFHTNSIFDPTYPVGYNYWHVQMGSEYDQVAQIEIFDKDGEYQGYGSGTLIQDPFNSSTKWILTAAHVVDSAHYLGASFPDYSDGYYFAESWYTPASWSGFEEDSDVGNDIALIKLTSNTKDITPMAINRATPLDGAEFTAVGYGRTGDGYSGAVYSDWPLQTRRAGTNNYDMTMTFDRILLADFDVEPWNSPYLDPSLWVNAEEDFPDTFEYLIGPGDSGGPDVIHDTVAGVHSFGWGLYDGVADSSYLDYSGAINVAAWAWWIDAVMAADGDPAILDPTVTTTGAWDDPILGSIAEVTAQRERYNAALLQAMFELRLELLASGDPDKQAIAEWLDLNLLAMGDDRYAAWSGLLAGTPLANAPYRAKVPEPATLALVGLGGLTLLRRRRRA